MRKYASSSRKQQQQHPQTPVAAASPQPLDQYERFEHWLRENGAKFDQVRLACLYSLIWPPIFESCVIIWFACCHLQLYCF